MKSSISKKQLREFGLLIGLVLPILIGWILPALRGHDFQKWTLVVAFPSIVLGIIKPNLLFYPYSFWMKLGHVLGWLNSRIILGVVFIIVLQPIALIMKFFGHDPLRLKKLDQTSYRENKKHYKIDLRKIF